MTIDEFVALMNKVDYTTLIRCDDDQFFIMAAKEKDGTVNLDAAIESGGNCDTIEQALSVFAAQFSRD